MTSEISTDDPKAVKLTLNGTPVLSAGRYDVVIGQANGFGARIKVYAEGGENATHTHRDEEHLFFVLAGQATFHLERDGETTLIVDRFEGVLLPHGAFYRFESSGAENLVMLRVAQAGSDRRSRIGADDRPLPGGTPENRYVKGVPVPGRYFVAPREGPSPSS
jgi:mannose-6-phosphate isomerase-like protein (cupin superfamily)